MWINTPFGNTDENGRGLSRDDLDNRQHPASSFSLLSLNICGSSLHSIDFKASISVVQMKERRLNVRIAHEIRAFQERQVSELLAARQDFQTA